MGGRNKRRKDHVTLLKKERATSEDGASFKKSREGSAIKRPKGKRGGGYGDLGGIRLL